MIIHLWVNSHWNNQNECLWGDLQNHWYVLVCLGWQAVAALERWILNWSPGKWCQSIVHHFWIESTRTRKIEMSVVIMDVWCVCVCVRERERERERERVVRAEQILSFRAQFFHYWSRIKMWLKKGWWQLNQNEKSKSGSFATIPNSTISFQQPFHSSIRDKAKQMIITRINCAWSQFWKILYANRRTCGGLISLSLTLAK